MDLASFIRDVPDFPKQGIIFKDITPLLADAAALAETIERLAAPYDGKGIELVAGIESRGLIFGGAVARRLDAGFIPIRKPGKLPAETLRMDYELEYGSDAVEMHADAVRAGQKVLMLDDLLATGGTMAASCQMVRKLGGEIVGIALVIELCFLHGRDKLGDYPIHTLLQVQDE